MARAEAWNDEQGSPQISADFLARMERAEAQKARERQQQAAAADEFAAILEGIPEGGVASFALEEPPAPETNATSGPKDRNLSDVIARIRDEGPAEEEDALADDVLELGGKPVPQAEAESETTPTARPEPENAPLPEALLDPGGGERKRGLQAVTNLVLLGAVVVLGVLQYGQLQEERRMRGQLQAYQRALSELETHTTAVERRLADRAGERPAGVSRETVQEMLHKRSQAVDARLTAMEATLASLMVPAQAPAKAKPRAKEKAKARVEAEPTTTASVPVAKKTTAGSKKDAKPSGGKGWMVVLASSRDAAQARKAQKRLQQQVGKVEVRRARVKGHTVYRLVVPGFSSKQAAQAFRDRLQGKKGLEGAWIGRG